MITKHSPALSLSNIFRAFLALTLLQLFTSPLLAQTEQDQTALQAQAQAVLQNIQQLTDVYAEQAQQQQQLKEQLSEALTLDLEYIETVRGQEQRFLDEGNTAAALTITAQLVELQYAYQDKQIEHSQFEAIISIYNADIETASALYSHALHEVENLPWLADEQAAFAVIDALNQDYYQLMEDNYTKIQQIHNTIAEQRNELAQQAGNEPLPDGIDIVADLKTIASEKASLNQLRLQHYQDNQVTFEGDINGLSASGKLLYNQAINYILIAELFQKLNSQLGESFTLLADYHQQGSHSEQNAEQIGNYYNQRQSRYAVSMAKFDKIAKGLIHQAYAKEKLDRQDKTKIYFDVLEQYQFATSANQTLADTYTTLSDIEYWQQIYQTIKQDIESSVEENLATAAELEQLIAQTQEYEAQYERQINDENGVQSLSELEDVDQIQQPSTPTLTQVPAQGSEGYYVGSITGDVRVTPSGQPQWSMKLESPPGLHGSAPDVSLMVDAGGNVGLNVGSGISRCGSNLANDGVVKPVLFNTEDHFCLDGARLDLISGVHGSPGAEYRTRFSPFQKIVATGSDSGSINTPTGFIVHTRSGSKVYYGINQVNSDHVIQRSRGVIHSWKMAYMQDKTGNSVFYIYDELPAIDQQARPQLILSQIRYGGQSLASADLSVNFEYELGPNKASGYVLGEKMVSQYRLFRLNTATSNKVRRQYTLSYDQSEISSKSRVVSIQECAGNSVDSPCYRPSYFTYTSETSGWYQSNINQPDALQDQTGRSRGLVLDINADGHNDWIIAVTDENGTTTRKTWLGSAQGWQYSSQFSLPEVLFDYAAHDEGLPISTFADINADGRADIISAYNQDNAIHNKIWLNTENGFTLSSAQLPAPLFKLNAGSSPTGYAQFADINADGRDDMLVSVRESDAQIHQYTWLNQSVGDAINFVSSTQYQLPEVLLDYLDNPQGTGRGELIDINSDGLVDVVISVLTNQGESQAVYLHQGLGWKLDQDYALPIALTSYVDDEKGMVNAELVDINGDGLIDIWQAIKRADNSVNTAAWLNTGIDFAANIAFTPPWYTQQQHADGHTNLTGNLSDLDADGKPEFVLYYRSAESINYLNIWAHDGNNWVEARSDYQHLLPPIALYQQFTNENSIQLLQMADLDSDLRPESFTSLANVANGMKVYQGVTLAEGEQPGMLVEVVNGLKIASRLNYGISNDPELYTPSEKPSLYPDLASNSPMLLVKTLNKMDGLVHPDKLNVDDEKGWYAINHRYSGLRVHAHYGSLGFKSMRLNDNRSGNVVESEFSQTWPHTGQTERTTSHIDGVLISQSETEFDTLSLNNNQSIHPYSKVTSKKTYEQGQLASTTIKTIELDEFANVMQEKIIGSTSDNQSLETLKIYSYKNDTLNWLLGLQTKAVVTYKLQGSDDIINTTVAEYDANGNLISKTIEPDHTQAVTTQYEYDQFGNTIRSTISAQGETRSSSRRFTDDGRFLKSQTNPLGHSVSVKYSSLSGKLLRQTDANGLIKETVYNAFDFVIKEQVQREDAPGAREIALPYWCESSTKPACPDNAVYFVAALDDQGESPQTVYFDAYGRELLKKSIGWDAKAIYQTTEYDAFGRKLAVSKPGFDPYNLLKTTVSYDTLDRVVKRISAKGEVTTINHVLMSKSVTNALGQTTTVTNNIQGKPIKSVDNHGSITRYDYDAKGQLIATIDSQGNRIENNYDDFGRKIFMDDPDMGQWTYEYDAFGQMIAQTDAKGQQVSLQYDQLGRLVKRTEAEGDTLWQYDTAPLGDVGQAQGALHSVTGPNGYVRNHFYDQFSRPIKEQTTINGETYLSERGYFRASEKVAWTKYPSGLVMRTEHDAYGYPKSLASVDLNTYTNYLQANNDYQQLFYDAKDIEAENKDILDYHKNKYDFYVEEGKPLTDPIDALYKQGEGLTEEANELGERANANIKVAQRYEAQYRSAYRRYSAAAERANYHANQANLRQSKANYNASKVEFHYDVARQHWDMVLAHLGQICYNPKAVAEKNAECNVRDGAKEHHANSVSANVDKHINWMKGHQDKAEQYTNWYYGEMHHYRNHINQMNRAANEARQHESVMTTKLNHRNYHVRLARKIEKQYNAKVDEYELLVGAWRNREESGSSCIARENEDPNSEFCLVTKGEVQFAEDVYMATETYQQLAYHRDEYERIVAPVNEAIKAAEAMQQTVKEKEQLVLQSGTTYWQTLEVTAEGQIKKARQGNGVETTWSFDELGRNTAINAQHEDNVLQDMFFEYDAIGNLNARQDYANDIFENFSYDGINRLTNADLSGTGAQRYNMVGQQSQSFQYDDLGNITYKSDVGYYTYGQGMSIGNAGVHAVIETSGSINTNFNYDANGNQLTGNGRNAAYASFNKPLSIEKAGSRNEFDYGPERQMIHQLETVNGETRETAYVGSIYERTTKAGLIEAVHHLKISKYTIAVLKTTEDLSAINSTHYLHQDHLDSVVMITDELGEVVEKNYYDPFGKKRLAVVDLDAQPLAAGLFAITDRSFTGHRYMAGLGLVNMKGRVYDPTFGRFLSADPHIQSPLNSQSLNRYSYVVNNPLSLNDPSGYFFSSLKKLWKKIKRLIKKIIKKIVKIIIKHINFQIRLIPNSSLRGFVQRNWQTIAIVVAAIWCQVCLAPMMKAFAVLNAAMAFASGASLTKTLAIAAVQWTLAGTGNSGFENRFGDFLKNIRTGIGNFTKSLSGKIGSSYVGNLITNGLVSGAVSKLFGGSFSKAFVSRIKNSVITSVAFTGGYLLKTYLTDGFSNAAGTRFKPANFNENGDKPKDLSVKDNMCGSGPVQCIANAPSGANAPSDHPKFSGTYHNGNKIAEYSCKNDGGSCSFFAPSDGTKVYGASDSRSFVSPLDQTHSTIYYDTDWFTVNPDSWIDRIFKYNSDFIDELLTVQQEK